MIYADVAVIGGGPAGMSAAVAAKEAGAGKVMLIERPYAGRDIAPVHPQWFWPAQI